MRSNQIEPLRILFYPVDARSPLSPGSWQWGGVWGHSWHVDPTRKLTIVNLTNTTLEGMVGQMVRDVQQAAVGA